MISDLERSIKELIGETKDRELFIAHKKVQKTVNQRINKTINYAKEDLVKNEGLDSSNK